MRHSRVKTGRGGQRGFSLVEIMVALVVIAVGLIAIVGLIPQGIQSSRSAADNTLVATIVHDVFNIVRSQPFATVNLNGLGFNPPGYNLSQAGAQSGVAYFDSSGFPTAAQADRYYRVTLNFQHHATLPLSLVTATVAWQAKTAAAAPPNPQVFFTEIAQYQ